MELQTGATRAVPEEAEKLLEAARAVFPKRFGADSRANAIEKGGSDRRFFRLCGEGMSLIGICYSGNRPENARYVELARFLDACGVAVPEVLFHDPRGGLILMQDLGEWDLWNLRGEPWAVRRPQYEAALREVWKIHGPASERHARGGGPELEMAFDRELYLWEQRYFFEHCVGGALGMKESGWKPVAESPGLQRLAARLASLPRRLVHRDFQSTNILLHADRCWLIDFQGLRLGLPQYDVASLLYDPYADLASDERAALLAYYKSLAGAEAAPDFDRVYLECAAQRLMQALGAYGRLGIQDGKRSFLRHIPTAWRSLCGVASELDDPAAFCKLLNSVQP